MIVNTCHFGEWQGEMKLLMDLLPRYHEHVDDHPHTLLVKFFGLHRVKPNNGSKVQSPATS